MQVKKLSVFELGKLGATMVGCFASDGYDVIGVDVNEKSVAKVAAGEAPVAEPGLQELYDENKSRISATLDAGHAVRDSDVSFIIVPTPSMPDGEFFTSMAAKVAELSPPCLCVSVVGLVGEGTHHGGTEVRRGGDRVDSSLLASQAAPNFPDGSLELRKRSGAHSCRKGVDRFQR